MIKSDPILAVKDVKASSEWYQSILNCKSIHGGDQFDILVDNGGEVIVCLHKWGVDEHPTMMDQNTMAGNGLILYLRTDKLDAIRKQVESLGHPIEEDIHINPNTNKREFSIRDLDNHFRISYL